MSKVRAFVGAATLAGALMAGSLAASAASMPSSFNTGADPHEVSITLTKQILEDLGFTDVRNILKDGRVFQAEAQWEGEPVNLRVDARDRSIHVAE